MSAPRFSLVTNHTPWRAERVECLREMLAELDPPRFGVPFFLNDIDYRGREWQQAKVAWALLQWRWAAQQGTSTHHVFLTDDLHVMPGFWSALHAMVEERPEVPIGLLSNHPKGPELYAEGVHGYRTNSWLVGPAYVLPRASLLAFLEWFETLPDGPHTTIGTKAYRNDDSSINEWNTHHGAREAWHPLPTIIEHRHDVESTTGHGDMFSRERLSWRALRGVHDEGHRFSWWCKHIKADTVAMRCRKFWATEAPMLSVGG